MDIRPNPGCANALCAQRQAEAAAAAASPEARRMNLLKDLLGFLIIFQSV